MKPIMNHPRCARNCGGLHLRIPLSRHDTMHIRVFQVSSYRDQLSRGNLKYPVVIQIRHISSEPLATRVEYSVAA